MSVRITLPICMMSGSAYVTAFRFLGPKTWWTFNFLSDAAESGSHDCHCSCPSNGTKVQVCFICCSNGVSLLRFGQIPRGDTNAQGDTENSRAEVNLLRGLQPAPCRRNLELGLTEVEGSCRIYFPALWHLRGCNLVLDKPPLRLHWEDKFCAT